MNANIAKVQSLIENAFTSAIEKLAKDESGNFISDLYVQADAESGELQIYDDEEHLIEKIVIFDLDFAKELPKTISGKIRRAEIKQGDWNEEGSEEEIKPQNVSDEAATDESAVEEKEGSIDE